MSKFEYVTAFVSIVMAIAVSEVLLGFGRLMRARSRASIYWVYPVWMAIAILGMTMHWWGIWAYEDFPFESYWSFLSVLAPSLTYVVIAFLLAPQTSATGEVDLRAQFLEIRRWGSVLGALLMAEFALIRTTIGGDPIFSVANCIRLALGAGFVWGAATSDSRVLRVAPYGAGALLAIFTLAMVFD